MFYVREYQVHAKNKMQLELTPETALHKASALCSTGEKCESDIREKLIAWGVNNETTDHIINHLIKENFLNEERFAACFVNDKFRFNKWGKIKITYALKQKKIAPTYIQQALSNIDEQEYLSTLKSLLTTKLKGLKYKDEYDKSAKLFRFALSRGFENEAIARIIKEIDK